MKAKQTKPRYSRDGALGILKRDIHLTLLELISQKRVRSFNFVNLELAEKAIMFNLKVVLNTVEQQEISYSIFFYNRQTFTKISVVDRPHRSIFIIINKDSAGLSKFKDSFKESIHQQYSGYLLEERVFDIVSERILKHPDSFFNYIKKTSHEVDRTGKDFELGLLHKGTVVPVFIDITSSANIKKKIKRNTIHGDNTIIIQTSHIELEDSALFLKRCKTLLKAELKKRLKG